MIPVYMRLLFTISAAACICIASSALAGGNFFTNEGSPEVTYIKNNKRVPDKSFQYQLRHTAVWQDFVAQHGTWYVEFNEENLKPRRAYGKPIPTFGTSPEDRAMNFISGALAGFKIPVQELELRKVNSNAKHHFINYTQRHQGLKVYNSRMMVKMTLDKKVISWGAQVFDNIDIKLAASFDKSAAANYATAGINESIVSSITQDELMILPIPGFRKYDYRLVYAVEVKTLEGSIPGDYFTLVDAKTGQVLYRYNRVMHHAKPKPKPKHAMPKPPGVIDVYTFADVYKFNTYIGASTEPLPNLKFEIGGNTYHTDGTGNLTTPEIGTQNGTFYLEGLYSAIYQNGAGSPPTFVESNMNSVVTNNVDFDGHANASDITAYYHVNIIHDYMKALFPTFTAMDNPLTTNVDLTSGDCNAFYSGSSINFYAAGNGCMSMATVGDVTYHEYGHGINDKYYQAMGAANFQNGAMNEGYADVWAFAKFEDPILGDGYSSSSPSASIRRYDINPKVYPDDIVGEVHADGEIIAGAWWDTYVNLGEDSLAMVQTMDLFALAFPGYAADEPNGQEGEAFTNTLIDLLEADDNNGDITDGTPNDAAITSAFALHGITLISNAEIVHQQVEAAAPNTGVKIDAELFISGPGVNYVDDVKLYYRLNNDPNWTGVAMTNTSGNDYTTTIPAQPEGTLIPYYIGVEDIYGNLAGVQPVGAEAAGDANIPYFCMVGFVPAATHDCDFSFFPGQWTVGLPSDNAQTGNWEENYPVGSRTDQGELVAPDHQHTDNGALCFITEQAASPTGGMGAQDVDDGTTTLITPILDLSGYENPTFTYYRWYTNSPAGGANPGADYWQAYITDDGTNWLPIEETKISDASWRRFAIRVKDYISNPTSTMQLKFNVSDSIRLGQNLDGGSLVEAAIDDVVLWENASLDAIDELASNYIDISMFPNPVNDELRISYDLLRSAEVRIEVFNTAGKLVHQNDLGIQRAGNKYHAVDFSGLADGLYHVSLTVGQEQTLKNISVNH